jgi:hypothetical protein
MDLPDKVRNWVIPLSRGDLTLAQANAQLEPIALKADDVPFLVRLVENPEYDFPGIEIFNGAASLWTHDQIHLVLGRGLLAKDEAFVIGFTMGSTDRVSATEEWLYAVFSRFLYPKGYRFSAEDIRVFRDAVRLGFVSDCVSLAQADFRAVQDLPLREARRRLGIEEDLLRAYYAIEKRRYPHAPESQRLLD